MRLVFKFGGSSLSNIQKIKDVAKFIKVAKEQDDIELVVVVSAMGTTTNKLARLSKQISNCTNSKAYGSLITSGEIVSASLLSMALGEIGVSSVCLTAKDVKIHAKGDPECSIITHINTKRIENELKSAKVVIITGFQGVDDRGDIVSLGRGGSDTTAVALGVVLNAEVKIYTDVEGYFSADPNKIENSKKLENICIGSAIELASAGAKVLDKRCLEIANKYKPNIEVLKSGETIGTKLNYENLEDYHIDGITFQNNLIFVKNTCKNTNKLQTNFQNENFDIKILSIEKEKNMINQILVIEASKNQANNIFYQKNNQNTYVSGCEIVVLAGSGLMFYKNFIQKVQNVLKNGKIYTFYIDLSQTFLKIVVKKHCAFKLAKLLAEEFDLVQKVDSN